jgi:uncharacterized protein YbjQ (UPF0145 family)
VVGVDPSPGALRALTWGWPGRPGCGWRPGSWCSRDRRAGGRHAHLDHLRAARLQGGTHPRPVLGLIVRSVGLTKGLTGTVRSLKAGEVKEFTEVVDRTRHTALERLIDHARQLGGNAFLGVRFDSSDLGNGLAEIVAYGTAATVRPA